MQAGPTAGVKNRRPASTRSISRFGRLDAFRLGNRTDQNKPHAGLSAQMGHRPAEVLRPPGLYDVAGSHLYGNPVANGASLALKKLVGPGSSFSRHCDRQRREDAGTTPAHGIEIHQIEPVESSMPVQIREVGQPTILDNEAAVRSRRKSA